jgi:MerR family transcriptional regulator, heat shock protein HspR
MTLYQWLQVLYISGILIRQANRRGNLWRRPAVVAPGSGTAVYAISVAAELTGAAVQNLRVYERRGLVEPARTGGGTRRYSEADLDRVRRILSLLEDGLNLAGIALVLDLEDDNARLRGLVEEERRD